MQASKKCSIVTTFIWEKLYKQDFPLCYLQPENSDWKAHYEKTYKGEVKFVVQSYYVDQLVCRNAIGRYVKYTLHRKIVHCFGHETNEERPTPPEERIRSLPPNIRSLDITQKDDTEVYIPPVPWSEFLKHGDEIELQWGSMHYWWRGVVDKIEGDDLTMIFTQFKQNWHFYREVAIYGNKNEKCGGVRKIEEPETVATWKEIFEERNLRLTIAAPDDFTGIGP